MGSAFHQLCPRYSGILTPASPMAIRLWETFTFYSLICALEVLLLMGSPAKYRHKYSCLFFCFPQSTLPELSTVGDP